MVAAAGFATVIGTTTLVAVTDDDQTAANASAAADQAKGRTQPSPARATTRGGSAKDTEDAKDADYWAEHAGNPGWSGSGSTGPRAGDGPARSRSGDLTNDEGSGATGSGGHEKKGPASTDAQKRSAGPTDSDGQNGPEGHSSRDRGREGQGGHGEEDGRQGRDGHHDSGNARGKARYVGCDPNDLISAIIDANRDGGGTLSLAEKCTYTLTANQDGNGLPEIVQPITIHGNGATIARAANADQFRFFQVSAGGDLKLRHLTLTRGKSAVDQNGGAILVNPAGRLDLDHTTLHNNTVNDTDFDDGGAIDNEGITTIRNSTFSNNSADDGGAIDNRSGKLEITTTKFTGNTALDDGGAVEEQQGTTTITKSLFRHNYAGGDGGALSVSSLGGLLNIETSTITHNTANNDGGGVEHAGSALHVRKSTIAHNTAANVGGGLGITSTSVIEDSKIHDNTSVDGSGGGIHIAAEGQEVAVRRTVISGNQAPGNGQTGGGIYIGTGDQLTLTDVKVTDNTSDEPAGGIHNDGTVTTYGKIKIIDNVPTNCEGSANPVPNCFG
ncbi:right-handed parallel beta-helix repeat-containing protein [Streptomyces sp. NPDC058991]|uniref:right-handed parallel beta-helix repeat-containing protein n=1 Tax=unclassified Streptomyces TaxID=2593676 RepID=UPI00367E3426